MIEIITLINSKLNDIVWGVPSNEKRANGSVSSFLLSYEAKRDAFAAGIYREAYFVSSFLI